MNEGRKRQAETVKRLWADPEYKAEMRRKISEGWKRRRAEIEASKPAKEVYHVPDLPGEVWKDVKGYEGKYAVSNMGRVKSLNRDLPHAEHGTWHINERLLKPAWSGYRADHSDGYMFVFLHSGGGKQKIKRIHRLVAEHFLPTNEGREVVNHIDCDRSNNRADNLEWVTPKENSQHARRNNRFDYSDRCRKVMNEETGEVFNSVTEAERTYNVASGAIQHAATKGRTSCGCHWRYV